MALKRYKKRKKLSLAKVVFIVSLIFLGLLYIDYAAKKRPKPITEKPEKAEVKIEKPVSETPVKPKIAIIIDDMGYNKESFEEYLKFNIKLTFSFFSEGTHTKELAEKAYAAGYDVMLHLPMEPLSYPKDNPGDNAIFVNMNKDDIKKLVDKHIKNVPFVIAVNNHMGSKATQEKNIMLPVMEQIKNNTLFFVDSITTEKSICKEVAKEVGIKFLERDIFIDAEQTEEYSKNALHRIINLAKKKKTAIAIGHPIKTTIEAFKSELPSLLKEDVEFVTISQLTK